ncbi:hypothetical protein G7Y79_00005g016910 [Physcia stellaris]|nr:hypothetical protein G7Y79_00005g016910 [Physcia stellaris]
MGAKDVQRLERALQSFTLQFGLTDEERQRIIARDQARFDEQKAISIEKQQQEQEQEAEQARIAKESRSICMQTLRLRNFLATPSSISISRITIRRRPKRLQAKWRYPHQTSPPNLTERDRHTNTKRDRHTNTPLYTKSGARQDHEK